MRMMPPEKSLLKCALRTPEDFTPPDQHAIDKNKPQAHVDPQERKAAPLKGGKSMRGAFRMLGPLPDIKKKPATKTKIDRKPPVRNQPNLLVASWGNNISGHE